MILNYDIIEMVINLSNIFYEKRKREKIGKCNICGKESILTWDHVPPKFCFNDGKTKYNKILGFNDPNEKNKISQNGIKFRSICDNCNNKLLGSDYDKEYKKLIDVLYEIYIKPGEIGQFIIVKGIKLNKVARAIVGHFLAAKDSFSENKIEKDLRKYFLDTQKLPPANLKLLYYVYIYNTMMIIRDIVPKKIGNEEYCIPDGLMSCLNAFPLGLILVDKNTVDCGLYNLFENCTSNIDDEIDIKIDLLSYLYNDKKTARDPYWPCSVSDEITGTSMIVLSEDSQKYSVFSQIRNLNRK